MTQAAREHPLLPKAWVCFRNGEIQQAKELCRQVIDESPLAAPHAWLLIALCELKDGDVAGAEDALDEIPEMMELRVPTTTVRAQCALLQGEHAAAKVAFLVALDYQPDSIDALYGLAQAHYGLGELLAAREAARRVVAIQPEHATAHFLLGVAALNDGDAQEAIGAFGAAAKLLPESPEIHNNLGLAYQMAEDLVRAERHYRRAVALKDDFGHAWYNLAAIVGAADRYDEAEQCYDKAIAADAALSEHGKPWAHAKA